MSFVRSASQVGRVGARAPASRATPIAWTAQRAFSQSAARKSDQHAEETFEEFTARYDASVEGPCSRAGEAATRGREAVELMFVTVK
jgi:cytochrome c oxidase subunit 5a